MSDSASQVRVFVVAPDDVVKERKTVNGAVVEVEASTRGPVAVRVLEWGAFSEAPTSPRDVLVGVFWTTLGGEGIPSRESFARIYERWRRAGAPTFVYFCERPFLRESSEVEPPKRMVAFREWAERDGTVRAFETPDDLARAVRLDLGPIVRGVAEASGPRPGDRTDKAAFVAEGVGAMYETFTDLAAAVMATDDDLEFTGGHTPGRSLVVHKRRRGRLRTATKCALHLRRVDLDYQITLTTAGNVAEFVLYKTFRADASMTAEVREAEGRLSFALYRERLVGRSLLAEGMSARELAAMLWEGLLDCP